MAAPKTDLSKPGGSKLFKTFDIALKKSERHLVLSTTYGLNTSWSKKITVGLRLWLDGSFEPVVKLLNSYSSGVSLSAAAWEDLVGRFDSLENYFESNERAAGRLSSLLKDTIHLPDGCGVRFTTAHGGKVLAFYVPSSKVLEDSQRFDEDDVEPRAKKAKNYTPVIVMQKVTFDGLKHIACCVNEHLLGLEILVDEVNRTKELLVKYFTSVVKSRKMKSPTLQQIGVLVCEEADKARETVSLES